MLANKVKTKESEKSRKENIDITFEKLRTKSVKELKTLDELMSEKN